MDEQKIELRKVRDFGENFSDTFAFLKQNLKSILPPFIAISGVLVLAQAILGALVRIRMQGVFNQASIGGTPDPWQIIGAIFSPEYFLLIILAIIAWVAMTLSLCAYMRAYVDNGGEHPTLAQVWHIFVRKFIPVFFASILSSIIIFVGVMFCILPGIYFSIVLMPLCMVMVMEDKGIGEAFSRCFEIIKDNFWTSLAIYLVAGIIYFAASLIIGLIFGIFTAASTIVTAESLTNESSTSLIVFTVLMDLLPRFFYIIFFISTALQYFSLVELRDGTGILNRINTIGDSSQHNNIEEQY